MDQVTMKKQMIEAMKKKRDRKWGNKKPKRERKKSEKGKRKLSDYNCYMKFCINNGKKFEECASGWKTMSDDLKREYSMLNSKGCPIKTNERG